MMESLIRGLPDCTTKTSFSRTLVKMRTLVSPFFGGKERKRLARQEERGTKARAAGEQAHIGELRQLCVCRLHPQVLTYLPRQRRARIAGKDERVAHCDGDEAELRRLRIAHEVDAGELKG